MRWGGGSSRRERPRPGLQGAPEGGPQVLQPEGGLRRSRPGQAHEGVPSSLGGGGSPVAGGGAHGQYKFMGKKFSVIQVFFLVNFPISQDI